MSIVVPVVRTAAGERAIELAKQEAQAREVELLLVGNATVTDKIEENVEALREYLTQLEKSLIDEGFQCRSEWSVRAPLRSREAGSTH